MAERKLAVRVELTASGDLERRLDSASGKADQLKSKTEAAGRVPVQQGVQPGARMPFTGPPAPRITPPPLPSSRITPQDSGDSQSNVRFGLLTTTVGRITFALGALVGAARLVSTAFNTVGDRAVLAADALARAASVQSILTGAAQGQRITRAQYEEALPAEFRARLEAAPAEQRTVMLQQELQRLRAQAGNAQATSLAGARVQALLEPLRHINLTQMENPIQQLGIPGGDLLARLTPPGLLQMTSWVAGQADVASPREIQRLAAIEQAMRGAGIAEGDITQRTRRLQLEQRPALSATTMSAEQMRVIAQIAGGATSTAEAAAQQRVIMQLQQNGLPGLLPGMDQQRAEYSGSFRAGEFYERLVASIGRPEEADQRNWQDELLTTLGQVREVLGNMVPPGGVQPRPNPGGI